MTTTQGLIVFKHDSALGNFSAHKLFDLVQVKRKTDPSKPAREFADYEIIIDKAQVPASVTLDAKI